KGMRVLDPACGSGAFLVAAFDFLHGEYDRVYRRLAELSGRQMGLYDLDRLILNNNLYGVDLNPESVEITKLSLWLKTAHKERKLDNLDDNIRCGNSLLAPPEAHGGDAEKRGMLADAYRAVPETIRERAFDWRAAFPSILESGGFDCVIGNPPWERLKLQEREFFSGRAPKIAAAVSAAERRRLIARLEKADPSLYASYRKAKEKAEVVLRHARTAGHFPLTARGDINTYMLFAELARTLVAPKGRVGLLVPSGIATDNTTRVFFNELVRSRSLVLLYDFENKEGMFPDVHRAFKFSTLVFGGREILTSAPDFVFFARNREQLRERERHISLSIDDMALLNPNTRTCPVFRTRRDAELTKAIYRRVPVLVEESRGDRGNPWGIRFLRMFDQTNDAELFHTQEQLKSKGFKPRGSRWSRRKQVFLPLYEAKMIQAYDHRAAGIAVEKKNWMRQGQTVPTSLVSHQKPEFAPQPRWWVDESEVLRTAGQPASWGFLGFKDITSPTNQRTVIAAAIPWSAVTNHFPLLCTATTPTLNLCLLANLNAYVLDYVARQKIGGITLNFFLVRQFPVLSPDAYSERCPWARRQRLETWISDRVLKLTCTSDEMVPLAQACEMDPPIHKWNPRERAELLAELHAAYFLLYGLKMDEAEYVLSTFPVADQVIDALGSPRSMRTLILDKYGTFASRCI
ncbi:MAG: N-6 DNA methylase, partial [Candidatus Krumholzibacteriota bacterium]|nr:N-6 DNA methylase [Candidatus Krumholzibacteriota bacterium]